MSPHVAPISTLYKSCICVLLSASLAVVAIPQLIQVHVITRHGSRTVLEKAGSGQVATTSPILTPLGEKQLYELGTWLRRRYAIADPLLGNYVANEVRFESSDLECTISSANALTLGVYPPANRTSKASLLPTNLYPSIPIYMKGARNDVFIRAYDKCPAFQNALVNLQASDAWNALEADHRTLLNFLGEVAEFQSYVNDEGYVPLSDVWNVYDMINVAKTECTAAATTEDSYCEFNPLDDDKWSELQTIAHKAEIHRYSNTTAGDLLGANLLFQIHQRMGGDTSGFTQGSSPSDVTGFRKFFHYSADYPTILSIFAALNVPPPSNEIIPGYGAALVFELYNDPVTGAYTVYMLYKEAKSSSAMTVRFPAGACQGATSCALSDMTQLLSSMSYTSLEEWCVLCDNDSADVCLEVNVNAPVPVPVAPTTNPPNLVLEPTPDMSQTDGIPSVGQQQEQEQSDSTIGNATCSSSVGSIIGAFCGGILLSILLSFMYKKFMTTKRRKDVDVDTIDPDNIINLDYSDKVI